MTYPRVLHVGAEQIGGPSNSGLTLGTMFGSWPDDLLLQMCWGAPTAVVDGRRIIMVPPMSAPVERLVNGMISSPWRVRRHQARGVVTESDGMNNSVARYGRRSVRQRLRLNVSAINDIGPVWLPPSLRNTSRRFGADVVHSFLGGVRVMRLALALSRFLDCPIVPHFMDDWVGNLFTNGQFGGYARAQANHVFEQILRRSPVCMVVGDDMAREFERRLRRPCRVVGNSVDLRQYDVSRPKGNHDRRTLVMRYVGGLHLGRDEVVAALAGAIRSDDADVKWELQLFVPDSDRLRAERLAGRFTAVKYVGHVQSTGVPDVLSTADALLFVESDAPGLLQFTRLSVSTKVPQYLAAGRPVLVIGPREQSSVRALLRSESSVYAGPAACSRELREATARVTILAKDARRQPIRARPSWLEDTFGQAATQERLRDCLLEASRTAPLRKLGRSG